MEGYGATIKRWRATRHMSQQALAVAVGMSAAAVTQWEREVVVPRRETATKIDEALEANGEILEATGHGRATSDHGGRISLLEEQVAMLQRQLVELAVVVRDLGERTLLPDADELQHPGESRTAQ